MMNDICITRNDSREFYERDAKTYDRERWLTDAGRYIDYVQKKIIFGMSECWKNKTILDVGTGSGRFSIELAKRGADVVGIDISLAMLHAARTKSEHEGLSKSVTLMNGNAIQLPFKDAAFDACICINVLNHIPRYMDAIKEIGRVLRPDGFLIGSLTNMLSCYFPAAIVVNMRRKASRRDVYTCWHTISQIEDACSAAGLEIEEWKGQLHFPTDTRYPFLAMLKRIDPFLRHSFLARFAPNLFIRAVKTLMPG